MILERTGVEPTVAVREPEQLVPDPRRPLDVDAIDRADRRQIAIGEIIDAARVEPGADRGERGGAGARTDDQQMVERAS